MDKIVILLSTYNGEKFLDTQLDSIARQTVDAEIQIVARDDGSADGTIDLLRLWQNRLNISIIRGKNVGPKNSFLKLLAAAPEAEFFAFCDQDDIWLPNKLKAAVLQLKNQPTDIPLLYFSNLILVDKNGNDLHDTYLKETPKINLGTLFVRNPAAGCTIVFNQPALDMWKKSQIYATTLHDTLMTRICYLNGKVIYDPHSYIHYRQHDANFAGREKSFRKRMKQRYRVWVKADGCPISIQAQELKRAFPDVESKNLEVLDKFIDYRKNLISKFWLLTNQDILTEDKRVNRSFKVRTLLGLV